MKGTTITLVLACALLCASLPSACTCNEKDKATKKRGVKQPAPKPGPRAVAALQGLKVKHFADAMCACKGLACVQQTSRDYISWTRKQGRMKLNKLEGRLAVANKRRMNECMKSAMRGAR